MMVLMMRMMMTMMPSVITVGTVANGDYNAANDDGATMHPLAVVNVY